MNQFFSISSLPLNIILAACYLLAAVFGIGIHAHETLSHHHDGVDEHAHHVVLHSHNDLGNGNATPAILAEDNAHEHDVPTLQLSGVKNSRSNEQCLTHTLSIVNLATETFRLHNNDCIVATFLPDASPPLQSYLNSNQKGRAPPAA